MSNLTRRVTGSCTRRTHTPRSRARRRAVVTVALVLGILGVLALGAAPASAAIPSNFFTVVDTGGANDVNSGQVDLTQMGRDDTDPNTFKLFWSWDATNDWTGVGQTGDACALFDTDGDGNINAVVCVRINNPLADPSRVTQTPSSPFVFTCTDLRSDRCSQPTGPLPYTASDIQSGVLTGSGTPAPSPPGNLITNTDPFPNLNPDQDFPNDSSIQVNISKLFLPAGASLVNVCSYPSAGNGGNNNPFDCIVNPGGGFLKIVKSASGADAASTTFNFAVNPGSISKSITGSGDTGAFTVPIGTNYSAAETVPAGWSLTGASCTLEGGGSTGSLSGSTVSGITVQSGLVTTCTFTDVQNNPALSITKVATESGFSHLGDVIHYTVVATNTGNTTLAAVTVTDPNVSNLVCTPANGSSLAPGATMNCTASHTIVQADLDAGHFFNQACVDDGAGGAAQQCASVDTPGNPPASLDITKVATESGFSHLGDVIHYTIVATNTGQVTLHNVDVTDAQVSDLSCSPSTPVANLAPGASITCSASHTITQADLDAGHFFNQACVDDGDGGAAQQCADVDTPGTKNPHLKITKVATESGYSAVGDVIHYTVVATNDGNVTLTNVSVTDPNVSDLSCTPTTPVASLAPGGTISCTASHTIVQADLTAGHFFNQACVDDGPGGAAQQCADVTTPGFGQCSTGYPSTSATASPLQKVAFNESEVLRFSQYDKANNRIELFYNDEHALALGVRSVKVNGITTTYPVSPLPSSPNSVSPPMTGAPYYTPAQLGDVPATVTPLNLAIDQGTKSPAGAPGSSDASGRPMFPSLFVTDITSDPTAKSGDWQNGGSPVKPSAVFGSWKAFTESITSTSVTLTADSDPAKNNWNLAAGSDTPTVGFAALKNEGYGAEARWNVADLGLASGHAYRLYFMDHDGDQNKAGGDSGQACINVVIP